MQSGLLRSDQPARHRQALLFAAIVSVLAAPGTLLLRAQSALDTQLAVSHPECVFYGVDHDKYASAGLQAGANKSHHTFVLSKATEEVVKQLPLLPTSTRTGAMQQFEKMGTIDANLFMAMQAAGVAPAPATTDFEFIRRVTLDLTGRIPAPDRVISFVNDASPNKRAALIDELLARPEWTDKWTMYFGDLYQNNSRNSQIPRFAQGRNAFYQYIHDSLAANKPYDQMAREVISAQGPDTFSQGELNWIIGGVVTGGPAQDIWDQQAANVADTFLGIAHMNCLLCHNGRGHLDSLSLWGSQGTRYQAWQFSSFMSHTTFSRTPIAGQQNIFSWSALDTVKTNYALNTTTGNRPARQPSGTPNGTDKTVAPVYWFSGAKPATGQDYRAALAQYVTSDFQFARATVNFIWAQFFGRGIVDPPDQFDLARLDPAKPPPAPWTLQPSNPALLQGLAQDFIASKYDLKALMRQIANSQAYQLSSRYTGTWNEAWEPLFARKMVRRLWAEEVHDAIAQSSNLLPSYTITQNLVTFGPVNWAMQLPETAGLPDGPAGRISLFLDAFLRGNRDDQQRRGDGSISQALDLMNDTFVMSRIRATGSGATASLLAKNLSLPDNQLVNTLFLTVLSRYPTPAEMSAALASLQSGNRTQQAQSLLWSLYNKVDFVFNY